MPHTTPPPVLNAYGSPEATQGASRGGPKCTSNHSKTRRVQEEEAEHTLHMAHVSTTCFSGFQDNRRNIT